MFSNKIMVTICDIRTETDPTTLDKTKIVDNARQVVCEKEFVGIQTQQLAQSQQMNFRYSIVVDRMFYGNQKYLYLENEVYKIETVALGKHKKDCKLIVSVFEDEDIKNAIETWLNK